jgi:cell division septation protein DedD
MIVAVAMVLQRVEGLSDREAVDRFAFDARWKYAAGGLDFDYPGFVHTVLVDMRARLARSSRPDRIFEATLEVARAAGLVSRKRVLDSTPLYDAVATMDTITLIRSAVRALLAAADVGLAARLRAAVSSGDDYVDTAKPQIDWDDQAARDALIDSLVRDGFAMLTVLEGHELDGGVDKAARLLATVLGQDLVEDTDGVFRIARKVAPDRVISAVDPETRHGHKTRARGFDGYKGISRSIPTPRSSPRPRSPPATAVTPRSPKPSWPTSCPPKPKPKPKPKPTPKPGIKRRCMGMRPTGRGNCWNGWMTPTFTMG